MTATYTFDIFCSLDGYGSYGPDGDWGGYWGTQGPEFLDHRAQQYAEDMRLVLGANIFRMFEKYLGALTRENEADDPINTRMKYAPTTIISSTIDAAPQWPDADIASGDAVDIVRRLKSESPVPLRSHGSIALNRSLMTAGLVDFVQVTIFPVLTGATGTAPVFDGASDFDLDLVSSTVLDGRIQELVYRPALHRKA